jgi:thioredoxin reductase
VYDVVIVGGGPAGLSAALVLGRCRRQVLLCDAGRPRNAAARALHGYLTRDGTAPLDLLRIGRQELQVYEVEQRPATVAAITGRVGRFQVRLDDGQLIHARAVLLATGVQDHLPSLPGLDACYGISAHHCPYCDGWEVRDSRLAVLGDGRGAAGLALSLTTWSGRVTVCTNGRSRLGPTQRDQLASRGITIEEARLRTVEHEEGRVRRLVTRDGADIPCDAIFFAGGQHQQCGLAEALGCEFTRRGTVRTDRLGQTCVPGVYVAGDASRDVQFVIVAAAEGAKAGVAINKALQAAAGLTVPADERP